MSYVHPVKVAGGIRNHVRGIPSSVLVETRPATRDKDLPGIFVRTRNASGYVIHDTRCPFSKDGSLVPVDDIGEPYASYGVRQVCCTNCRRHDWLWDWTVKIDDDWG